MSQQHHHKHHKSSKTTVDRDQSTPAKNAQFHFFNGDLPPLPDDDGVDDEFQMPQPPSCAAPGFRIIDAGMDDQMGGGMDGKNEPDLVPIMHPLDAEIENRLGLASPADAHCYICNVMDPSDPSKMSDEASQMLNFIDAGRRNNSDMVDLAIRIKTRFDQRIRNPANAIAAIRQEAAAHQGNGSPPTDLYDNSMLHDDLLKLSDAQCRDAGQTPPPQQSPEFVAEWTLRSIYNHIVYKDMSPGAQLDRGAAMIDRMLYTLNKSGVFVAERADVIPDKPVNIQNVRLDDRGCAKTVALLRTYLAYNKARLDQGTMMRANSISLGSSSSGSRQTVGSSSALSSSNVRRNAGGVSKRPTPASSIAAVSSGAKGQNTSSITRNMFH